MSVLNVSFIIWFFCCTFSISYIEMSDNNVCLDARAYFWKHLASKTPYRYVSPKNSSEVVYSGCRPKKLWAILRHGTRFPDAKVITKMKIRLSEIQESILANFDSKKGTLCPFSVSNISLWSPQMEVGDAKKLAHEGEDEMVELAERFQKRFPSLLGMEYSNSSHKFRCTATQRTIQSKYYFLVGLFSRKMAHHVWSPKPIYKDPLLRFYKLCPKWLKEVHKNPRSCFEIHTFKTLNETSKLLENISRRLGFENNLSFEDLEIMYTACSFESALYRLEPSPWCFIFTEKEMETMEFFRDLKHYWIDGYGYDINFRQACPLMKDMLSFIRSEKGPIVSFYFTHSGTLLKLISHLGLYYDDKKLTHETFGRPRLWKVGQIDAFSSNLAFVSFQCNDELKLLAMHQERVIRLPGCPKEDLCSLNKILKIFKGSLTNCDFEQICNDT